MADEKTPTLPRDMSRADFRNARDTFNLQFKDVLDNTTYRRSFRKFLEEEAKRDVKFLEFITAVNDLHTISDKVTSGAGDASALLNAAAAIKEKFMGNDSEFRISLALPSEVCDAIRDSAELMEDASKDKQIENARSLFDIAEHHITSYLEMQLYPRFINSEIYVDMMIERMNMEEDQQPNSRHLRSGSHAVPSMISSKVGWVNEAGYQSIHVDVLEARRLRDGTFGKSADAYCVCTVDSTSYRTQVISAKNPKWYDTDANSAHFEFPLRITSTHVVVNVFDHQMMRADKHLGSVEIPIADVVRAQEALGKVSSSADVDEIAAEEKERREKVEVMWLVIRKSVDDTKDAPKMRGEVRVRVFVSKLAPKNLDHKELIVENSSLVTEFIRTKVSKKKKRFIKDGFDLDLTYITDRVIAMGFPSEKFESVYRNPMETIKKFFKQRHNDHYKVYNLCAERHYDPAKFNHQVCRYPFYDHNPCPFEMIDDFCRDVNKWLNEHPQNIAAIHCKAGKGRTGLMIGCYMLYTQLFHSAAASLKFYAARRTHNNKGVTIPSQIRYVHYYDRYLRYNRMVSRAKDRIKSLSTEDMVALAKAGDHHAALNELNVMDVKDDMTEQQKEERRAAQILGFKNRKMSVMERADVYDYLQLRNDRLDHTSANKGSRAGSYFLPDDDKHAVFLTKIVVHSPPKEVGKSFGGVYFKVNNANTKLEYNSSHHKIRPRYDAKADSLTFEVPPGTVRLFGDVQTIFYYRGTVSKSKLFQYWLNTRFLVADDCTVMLTQPEVDKANKDHKNRNFKPNFKVEISVEMEKNLPNEELYSVLYGIQSHFQQFSKLIAEELGGRKRISSVISNETPPLPTLQEINDESDQEAANEHENLSDDDDDDITLTTRSAMSSVVSPTGDATAPSGAAATASNDSDPPPALPADND